MSLNPWSPADGTDGDGGLAGGSGPWGREALGVYSPALLPIPSLLHVLPRCEEARGCQQQTLAAL